MTRKMVIGSRLLSATLLAMRLPGVVNGNGTHPCELVYLALTQQFVLAAPTRPTLSTRASGMRL